MGVGIGDAGESNSDLNKSDSKSRRTFWLNVGNFKLTDSELNFSQEEPLWLASSDLSDPPTSAVEPSSNAPIKRQWNWKCSPHWICHTMNLQLLLKSAKQCPSIASAERCGQRHQGQVGQLRLMLRLMVAVLIPIHKSHDVSQLSPDEQPTKICLASWESL